MHLDFDAGKYAVYIWPAYGALVLVVGWMVIDSVLSARRWRLEAGRLQAEKDARKADRP
jgi:heme exporter protein D